MRNRTSSRQKTSATCGHRLGVTRWCRRDAANLVSGPKGRRAFVGVPATVEEIRSAFADSVEDDAIEAAAEVFRQSSCEGEDASSSADHVCGRELMVDDLGLNHIRPNLRATVGSVHRVMLSFEVTMSCGRYQVDWNWRHKVRCGWPCTGLLSRTHTSGKRKCKLLLDIGGSFGHLNAELLIMTDCWHWFGR